MRKQFYLLITALLVATAADAQRFLTEVFPSFTKTSNITYGRNKTIFPTGLPTAQDLQMDIYEPAGLPDDMGRRPLIIFMHTGSYLPAVVNQSPSGSRNDSATVEICKRFARRGYIVANMDYRLGWNPQGSDVDIRRGTLINAVYRSLQDAKACVRFFYKDASTTNTYKVDTNAIILGGQGTGGYVAVNYPCLRDPAQIAIPKYISSTTNATYGFTAGQPYVNMAALGDYDGHGGIAALNIDSNSNGYSTKISFVFNMGGALGDSTWIDSNYAPMVAFHPTDDPYAPYGNGIVYVPTIPPQIVVDVSGSGAFIPMVNARGQNACFNPNNFTDAYTNRANIINGGEEGLFPFITPANVPYGHSGLWEWYDSTALQQYAQAIGYQASYVADTVYPNALLTNPTMSKAQAMAYIDTIMGYLNPRIVTCLGLHAWPLSVQQVATANDIKVYPNPATDIVYVQSANAAISAITVRDMIGREIKSVSGRKTQMAYMSLAEAPPGIYFMTIDTEAGSITRKITVK